MVFPSHVAITSANVWYNILHTYFDYNIYQGNQTTNGITSAKNKYNYINIPNNIIGYTFTYTPIVLVRTTFSSDLEEAMTESGKSLSNSKNYCSVFEKISKINDVKQNEKHPFTYIMLHTQELKMCKKIGYKYYCEELFVVKSKTRYSCTSTIYFNLESDVIRVNCEFQYYYNKTDIKPIVLYSGFQIILAN